MQQNSPWIRNVSELPIMFVSIFILPVIMQHKELRRLQMTRLSNEQQRIQNSISLQRQGTLSSTVSKPAPRPSQPPIHCIMGTLSPGWKQQQGSIATHSTPSSLNVKNVYSSSTALPIFLHGMHKDVTSFRYSHMHQTSISLSKFYLFPNWCTSELS
jgi:hypothetical protein